MVYSFRTVKEDCDRGFDALEEEDESQTADEIYALIEREKDGFVSFEEYAKRRGIKL